MIGLYGLIFFPDTPEKTTAFYLSKAERERCVERLAEEDRAPVGNFSWSVFKRIVTSWQFYVLTILWMSVSLETAYPIGAEADSQQVLANDSRQSWQYRLPAVLEV